MKGQARVNASLTDDERYRLLIEAVTDYAIYMLDPDGYITSWNPGAERFKGYTASEIIGCHFSKFYTEEDRKAGLPEKGLHNARTLGRHASEGWRVRKDGSCFWADVIIDPIRTPDGDLVGFAKITRDLTERRQADQALRRSQEQFRLLVESVTDYAIYVLDPQGRVTTWNSGAQRIKGYTPDEIIGQHFSRFFTEEDQKAGLPERVLGIAARDGKFESEGWRVRKDGSRFWGSAVVDAIRNDDGSLFGFAKIIRDITELRDAQRALDQAREALYQSQKMEAIGQLTGGVAHDFNNLLMAILGSLELVRKRLPDDPRITPLIDNAMQGAHRGATLTQRMLAFARRQELDIRPIDLPALVHDISDLLQSSLGPIITLETRFPAALPSVRADANQLEMALLNLVVNSRDAMPAGGAITISARTEDVAETIAGLVRAGRYVCLSVSDTGEGMDEATLARAMEPFFTTKGVGKGTGLGLSMVHGLAEQFGGRFVLQSQLHGGTRAEIWLPAAASAATAMATAPAQAAARGRSLNVLAVDDDGLVLMNTAAMLEDLGHTVFEASSGRQALAILQERDNIDLVITDQAMPVMTGSQLAEAIRAQRPDLPIILATGYAEIPQGKDLALPKLAKPFLQEDLAQAVRAQFPA
ncbi:MAG: PAS domain-containing sensor histidine kinase [Bradyrhizobiaceae bacterium]|nr:MAG: PAS domain-containing sensor histidine kinase [Bradyrhizobiaceae bacterium]